MRTSLSTPAVTVMMPAYNAAKYLAASLRSVLEQDCSDFEIVLIDDGSTDKTYEIIKPFYRDPRLRLYRNPSRMGIIATRNKLLALSRGTWVVPHDADDIMVPGRLREQLHFLKGKPNAGGVFGLGIVIGKKVSWGVFGCRGVYENGWLKEGLVKTMPLDFHHGTSMVRKDLIAKAGGYDSLLSRGAELRLFRRLFRMAPFYFIKRFCLVYRKYANSSSMTAVKTRTRFLRGLFSRKADTSAWRIRLHNTTIPLEGLSVSKKKLLMWRFNLYIQKGPQALRGFLRSKSSLNTFKLQLGRKMARKNCAFVDGAMLSRDEKGVLVLFETKTTSNGMALLSFINKGYVYHSSENTILDFNENELYSKECLDPLLVNLPRTLKVQGVFWNPILKKSYLAMDLFSIGAVGGRCRIVKIVVLKISASRSRKPPKPLTQRKKQETILKRLFWGGIKAPRLAKLMKTISRIPAYKMCLNRHDLRKCASFQNSTHWESLNLLRDLL